MRTGNPGRRLGIAQDIMTTARNPKLLPAIYRMLLDVEKAFGVSDPATIEVKRIIISRLAEMQLTESCEEAEFLEVAAAGPVQ